MINKTSLKFIAGFVVIIGLSLISLYLLQNYFSPEKRAERRYAELQKLYAEDTYGGKTPEETLQLFISALKAGDIELASKYFLPEDREKTVNDLKTASANNSITNVIERVEAFRLESKNENSAFFVVVDGKNVVQMQAMLGRNQRGIWKIIDL